MGGGGVMTKGLPNNKETEKSCPVCGAKLIVKTNRATEHQFLGCPRWPECNHTEQIPESMAMRLAGALTLFNFEEE